MKSFSKILLSLVLLYMTLAGCFFHKEGYIKTYGNEVVSFRVLPFALTDVKLLDGPFLHATELDVKTLLNYEPDRLLKFLF